MGMDLGRVQGEHINVTPLKCNAGRVQGEYKKWNAGNKQDFAIEHQDSNRYSSPSTKKLKSNIAIPFC